MKTKEFIEKVEEFGFNVEPDFTSTEEVLEITIGNNFIAYVSTACIF